MTIPRRDSLRGSGTAQSMENIRVEIITRRYMTGVCSTVSSHLHLTGKYSFLTDLGSRSVIPEYSIQ